MDVNNESSYFQSTLKKIENKEAKVAIIGLGYVGLPLSLNFSENGYSVFALDIDDKKLNNLRNSKSYISYINNDRVRKSQNNTTYTDNFELIFDADVIIICVPTPLSKHREPDLTYVINTINNTLPYLKKGQLLSLESTTYPGTTDEIVKPMIEKKNFMIGNDFFIIYSPERDDPGNKNYNTKNIPKVLGGITENCKQLGLNLYGKVINEIVPVSSTKAAEMTKLIENIQRAVNIGLVNELKILADRMNLDLYEIIRAASTKPFGFSTYYPGPGLGGHCIPIDPFYLTWKVKQFDMHTKFIELAGEINSSMPFYVIDKISSALNNQSKSIKNSKIIILGVSYKKNVEDIRESPSLYILDILLSKEAKVSYSDPFVKCLKNGMESIELNELNLKSQDLTLILTDHDNFDYDLIRKFSKLIIDTRGRYKVSEKIIRA